MVILGLYMGDVVGAMLLAVEGWVSTNRPTGS